MSEKYEDLESRLYDKSYICPVCDKKFKNKDIKKGKTIFIEMDLGLRGKFKPIMPDYYYVVMCDGCGYASITKTFNKTTNKQIKNIKENLNPNYRPKKYKSVLDGKEAIDRYKIALYFAHIKDSQQSEKAYIAQKIAFISGDINNKNQELEFNKHAYNWYNDAYIDERLPIMGMEENQFIYNLAYLAYKTGNIDEAKKTISKIMVKQDLSATLKEKIEDFVQILKNNDK